MRGADALQESMFTLQALYSIRSERQICEQSSCNLLFRWFTGIGMDDAPWDHSTFTKNRDRLLDHDVMRELFGQVISQARAQGPLSAEHFSVDGTLIRAQASDKSFMPKDGPPPPKSGSRANPEVGTSHENTPEVQQTASIRGL